MNFKPSKLKVLFAIIAFVVVDLFMAASTGCSSYVSNYSSGSYGGCPPWYAWTVEPMYLGLGLVAAILVYCVWSLVEKKK